MAIFSFLRREFSTFWYNFSWSDYVGYIDGWIPRFAFFVPIVGYLILFNDYVGGALAFNNLTDSKLQDFLLSSQARLRMVYFGLIFLGLSNLLYRLLRPYIFRFGTNRFDVVGTCLEHFTFGDFIEIHNKIRRDGHSTLDGKYYDSEWEGFKKNARNQGEGTNLVLSTGNWELAKQQYGSLLRSMLAEWFFKGDTSNRLILIACVVISTAGYILLLIPSADLFLKVVISTLN